MAVQHPDPSHRAFRIPKYIQKHFLVSILISCTLVLITTIAYFQLQPQVPLFYSLAEPNEYLADKVWLFIFPAFSFTITILHLLILPTLRTHHKIMNQLFAWLTVVIQSLCLVAAVRIISIVW